MQKNNKWLIISHAFNMDGRAASLTVTDKIPYLLEKGIDITVISAATGDRDQRLKHYQLLPWGPSGLRFDFRHWFANKFGRRGSYKLITSLLSIFLLPLTLIERLAIGLSSQASWALPAFLWGYIVCRRHKIDVIYSSSGAWSAHLAGWLLKKTTGLVWVAEIHDPMVIRWDELDNGVRPRKTRDKRFLQRLEGMICRDANRVWWFTQGALDYAKMRHPQLGEKGFFLMPGAEPPQISGCYSASGILHIAHFGSLARDRSLAPLIRGLHEVITSKQNLKERVIIDVYGAPLDEVSVKTIEELNMSDFVKVWGRLEFDPVTGLSGRGRAIQKMQQADVLLLLHGNYEWCAEYIPSKWYDYLWTKRPIFALTNRNFSFDQMLRERNSYLGKTLDHKSIVISVNQIIDDWTNGCLRQPVGEPILVRDAVEQLYVKIYE